MLSSLVISSSSNAVKYSSLFRSLGVEVSYLILDPSKNTAFAAFDQHRMYHNGVVHYFNPEDNSVHAHQQNYRLTEGFIQRLKDYFLEDLNLSKELPPSLVISDSNDPIQFFVKEDVVDLKFNKQAKNIQLEIKNKGLVSFDYLFIEQTDSCLEFVKEKSAPLVKSSDRSDLIWVSYNYKMSADFTREDFWYLEDRNYQSIFDNCFYLQPRDGQLSIWTLIPQHQYLNQQFHHDFQDRLRKKIESRFGFASLSFVSLADYTLHVANSHKLQVNANARVSGFPCFSFYSSQNVYKWFNQFSREFNKKHKVKSADQRV